MFGQRVAQQQDFGLLIAGKNTKVPLKEVAVKAQLRGYLVGLNSTLKYANDGSNPIEVVFRFPIEESFAVVGLEAEISDRKIKAEVKEKEEAKQMYDDAMASGFSAAFAEEKSGDIFSISLGNLPPQSEAKLHLKLAGELPIDAEGAVRFSLPAVLKPRYTPTGSTDPLKAVGAGVASNIAGSSVPAVFNFEMDALDATSVSHITSPTHTISTQTKFGGINVTLGDATPLDKDLLVLIHLNEPHSPKAIPEFGDRTLSQKKFMGCPAVMLNFFPKFETKQAACEFVFVIDRSGSMNGSFIRSASETLVLFLKSIPPGCSFNIIGFGSSYKTLFPSSVPYNQGNLDKAIKHAETLQADLGGTELLSPLRHVFSQPLLPGLPRQVFVLTDGSVSNTNTCIQEVRKNVKHSRVFTFGIGSGASTALVKGLAKAGNGTAEFIQEGERLQPKVISSLKRALQPSVTDLQVSFDVTSGFDSLEAPDKLPTIFNGDKTVIYGIFKSKAASELPLEAGVSGTASLKGKVFGVPFEHTIPFKIPPPSDSPDSDSFQMPIVHHLAAKSLIHDLEHKEGWASTASESECKQEMIRVSVESSVVSSHTAYIAVDEDQDKPIEGAIQMWDLSATMAADEKQRKHRMYGAPLFVGQLMSQSAGRAPTLGLASGAMHVGSAASASRLTSGIVSRAHDQPLCGGSLMSSALVARGSGVAGRFSGPPRPHYFSAPLPPSGGLFGGPPPSLPTSVMSFGAPPSPPPSDNLLQQPSNFAYVGAPACVGHSNIMSVKSFESESFHAGPPPPPTYNPYSSKSAASFMHKVSAGAMRFKSGESSDELTQLISLQLAEGFWRFDKVSTFMKKPISCPISGVESTVWATVIALVLLESRFSQQKDEWELVAMKAETWLSVQSLPSGVDIKKIREEAKKLV